MTTHVHRPMSAYLAALRRAGFAVDEMREPLPDRANAARFPEPWRYPRFLALRCVRTDAAVGRPG